MTSIHFFFVVVIVVFARKNIDQSIENFLFLVWLITSSSFISLSIWHYQSGHKHDVHHANGLYEFVTLTRLSFFAHAYASMNTHHRTNEHWRTLVNLLMYRFFCLLVGFFSLSRARLTFRHICVHSHFLDKTLREKKQKTYQILMWLLMRWEQ